MSLNWETHISPLSPSLVYMTRGMVAPGNLTGNVPGNLNNKKGKQWLSHNFLGDGITTEEGNASMEWHGQAQFTCKWRVYCSWLPRNCLEMLPCGLPKPKFIQRSPTEIHLWINVLAPSISKNGESDKPTSVVLGRASSQSFRFPHHATKQWSFIKFSGQVSLFVKKWHGFSFSLTKKGTWQAQHEFVLCFSIFKDKAGQSITAKSADRLKSLIVCLWCFHVCFVHVQIEL